MVLIAILMAIGQFAALRIFEYFEREPRAVAAAVQAITVVNYTKAALLASHADRRMALLTELSGTEGVRIYSADLLEEIEPLPKDPFIRLVVEKVHNRLGKETIVTVNHFGIPGLWVSFSIGQDDFWVVIPRVQAERAVPWQWLGWGALVISLALLGAFLIAERINRPLSLLVKAANRLRQGEHPPRLVEEGLDELREVSHAFNEMSEALARLDAERTLLLAGISHDIRTPLARLRLSVEMLPDEESGSLKAGMVQDISDMDNIIHQFLDFVRGIEGEPTQMIDINSLLKSIYDRHIRAGRNLVLKLSPTHLVPLRPLAIQRLLNNLIDNAFAYSRNEVTVTTVITAGSIILSVLDKGPGIPAAQMARLLRPFERMDTARGNEGGSGLGLAIASRIAKLHKGELTLLNRPEGGLEARLTLPIHMVN
ncbi:two-component sensor histidine kinase [Methylovorus sp. MM2]|uniref:sensor histidine kinase n=1 Tax=Methylovorus sp. MM2 TaxID=1848038 RepID=UPI0007DF69E3|nr:sensor histidine kinase [Methylovorus sp. MM2]OAM52427.1 two-component sensor histidine kinase [Methylovorus sp. MM2]